MSNDNSFTTKEHTDQIYNRFLNLAINRFDWDNLPIGLESRIIEKFLIDKGMVCFFKENDALYCLPCYAGNGINIYGEPTHYVTESINGQLNKTLLADEIVVVRNNALGINDRDDLLLFAERINDIEQTMDVNLFHQITPYIILCDEKERLTYKNILLKVRQFAFAIFGRKSLSVNQSDILDTRADYLLDKLQTQKQELWNELLTFLGINNNNVNKKERLVVDEVNANNDFILVNIDHMFDERQKAIEKVNKMFNVNITVSKREVETNGALHPDITTNN